MGARSGAPRTSACSWRKQALAAAPASPAGSRGRGGGWLDGRTCRCVHVQASTSEPVVWWRGRNRPDSPGQGSLSWHLRAAEHARACPLRQPKPAERSSPPPHLTCPARQCPAPRQVPGEGGHLPRREARRASLGHRRPAQVPLRDGLAGSGAGADGAAGLGRGGVVSALGRADVVSALGRGGPLTTECGTPRAPGRRRRGSGPRAPALAALFLAQAGPQRQGRGVLRPVQQGEHQVEAGQQRGRQPHIVLAGAHDEHLEQLGGMELHHQKRPAGWTHYTHPDPSSRTTNTKPLHLP